MGDYNCLAYGRFDAREKMVVVFNNNGEDRDLTIKVWPAEVEANQKLRRISSRTSRLYDGTGGIPGGSGRTQAPYAPYFCHGADGCAQWGENGKTNKDLRNP